MVAGWVRGLSVLSVGRDVGVAKVVSRRYVIEPVIKACEPASDHCLSPDMTLGR